MKPTDRISLSNVHVARFASEETACFNAVLCFDGIRVCEVSNDGKGGADHHRPLKGETYAQMAPRLALVNEWVATLTYEFDDRTFPHSIETAVGEALEAHQLEKRFERHMRSHLVYTRSDEPGQVFLAKVPKDKHSVALESWRNKRPGITYVALASLPRAEALAIYANAGRPQ